jgi:hypothetical protein
MKHLQFIILFILAPATIFAQDDLMNMLNQDSSKVINYTTATFKSTRVLDGHSIERMQAGQLDVRISHRFGAINSGAYNLFGLDQFTNVRLAMEYGITNWVMIGIGRVSYDKTFDGFAKFSVLRQSTGAKEMPVSLSIFTSATLKTLKNTDPTIKNYFTSRLAYVGQVLIARKFNQSFSFQIAPTYVHRNLVATELDPNDLFSVGAGGRMKLSKRVSLNAEYYALLNPKTWLSQPVHNPLSVGFDIETGGHVFQLFFANTIGMTEKAFIGETTGTWRKGDVYFGFNISRVFTLKKERKPVS